MILTITLNPALDKLVSADELIIGEANRVEILSALPAGKGIDVAKVLRDLACEVCVTGFLGGSVAPVFTDCFDKEGIRNAFVPIAGATRTNMQIFGRGGQRTELLEKGPTINGEEWAALLDRVDALLPACEACAICGSAPGGVSPLMVRDLIRRVKAAGKITVVDVSGALLHAAVGEAPHLIKPNRREMAELMGRESPTPEEVRAYAHALVEQGIAYVLVSLGRDGAMLVCREGVWRASAPDVPVKSTLGCGDTMVASLLLSLCERQTPAEMLRRATALSSANAMTFETAHIEPATYARLLPLCETERLV